MLVAVLDRRRMLWPPPASKRSVRCRARQEDDHLVIGLRARGGQIARTTCPASMDVGATGAASPLSAHYEEENNLMYQQLVSLASVRQRHRAHGGPPVWHSPLYVSMPKCWSLNAG